MFETSTCKAKTGRKTRILAMLTTSAVGEVPRKLGLHFLILEGTHSYKNKLQLVGNGASVALWGVLRKILLTCNSSFLSFQAAVVLLHPKSL